MKSKTTILLTALLSVIFIMASPTTGYSQITNYCKDGAGPGWWKRLWQKPYEKRESACFGRYAPKDFDAVSPKVVWDATAANYDGLQNEIDSLAGYLVKPTSIGQDRWKLYFNQIFLNANATEYNNFDYWSSSLKSDSTGHHKYSGYFSAAATAKYAAFVYIVGVIKVPDPAYPADRTKDLLKKFNDPYLDTLGIDGQAVLNEYRDRAINILEHLKKEGKQDFRPAPTMMITYGHYRYKETIGFLSAFELLRLSTLTNNRDLQYWQLKNAKLALQGTVRNLYQKTGVFIEGKSNNHTLQYAGAMGLASVVLYDCGSGRWKKTWHPSKWAGKANWHIENTLFENNDRHRMTEEGEMAGYAEGPHYMMYAFESLAPFLNAYKSFVPETHTEKADAGIWRGELTVDNHDTKQKFHNLYKWYNQVQTPGGRNASYDATFINTNYPYFLKTLNNGKNFRLPITSFGIVGEQYHPEVIGSENVMIKKDQQFFVNNKSGNIVLQSPFSMPDLST